MKNFKTLLFVFIIALITNNLFAQGPYVNINVGNGFRLSSQTSLNWYNWTGTTNSSTYEQVYVSLGKGLNLGGDIWSYV